MADPYAEVLANIVHLTVDELRDLMVVIAQEIQARKEQPTPDEDIH